MQPTLQSEIVLPEWVKYCRSQPYHHQIVGIEKIVAHPYFMLGDEMGAGKTLQAIVAAMLLFIEKEIDRVLIITPAPIRAVWFDPEFGELAKHLWTHIPSLVTEFHTRERHWTYGLDGPRVMSWTITNYDFISTKQRYEQIVPYCNKRTFLICDESSKVKNARALRTKAVMKLRKRCSRVLLLNGTPIAHSPRDMYAQGNLMDVGILETPYIYQFDARYAIKGGWENRETVGWRNLEDMQQRFAPYILRRLKTDCLDLPEKLPPVILNATLDTEWPVYKAMRDELIVWLEQPQSVSMAAQVIVKTLRLAQITSGFIGGVEVQRPEPEGRPEWMPFDGAAQSQPVDQSPTREIGRAKLDVYLDWLADRLEEDENFKLVTWCWFRPELRRLVQSIESHFPGVIVRQIHGDQRKIERENALRLLDLRTAPVGPAILVGTPDSGAMGYSFVAAHTMMYISSSHSLLHYVQSQDRVHRPGQTHSVSYYHILASGPKGERTIDHIIHKARQGKLDLATWTTAAWRTALLQE